MKKLLFVTIPFLLLTVGAIAQKSGLKISLANSTAKECDIWIYNAAERFGQGLNGTLALPLGKDNRFSHVFSFTQPQFIRLSCSSDTADSKHFYYNIFISPGDDILLSADFKKEKYAITVTGRGSRNNQAAIATPARLDQQKFYGDTVPYRVMAAINKQYAGDKSTLDDYIKQFKPSAAFIKASRYNIQYFPYRAYNKFKESNKDRIGQANDRNIAAWQKMQDSLSARAPLNNADALLSCNYIELIGDFLEGEKMRLVDVRFNQPEVFFKEWYNADVTLGTKLFNDDPENLLLEKIINKYFTGKCAEYLHAELLQAAISINDPKNVIDIFNRYKTLHPADTWFKAEIDTIIKKEQRVFDKQMIFVAGNGTNMNTIEDVLALTKGKTVLVDMWGTWCEPCRQELGQESPAIKAYFKGKGLDYLYIANHDLGNEDNWKKLIAYFDLGGTHILANTGLSKDIMAKVKGTGYPTYFIIKKDGTYELSKAGYPMNRAILIKQLEAALAL